MTHNEFQERYNQLLKDQDKSKILAINAMLAYDDGRAYTEQDYQKAIDHLIMGIKTIGDTSSGFVSKAIQWCKTRAKNCATNRIKSIPAAKNG